MVRQFPKILSNKVKATNDFHPPTTTSHQQPSPTTSHTHCHQPPQPLTNQWYSLSPSTYPLINTHLLLPSCASFHNWHPLSPNSHPVTNTHLLSLHSHSPKNTHSSINNLPACTTLPSAPYWPPVSHSLLKNCSRWTVSAHQQSAT